MLPRLASENAGAEKEQNILDVLSETLING